MTRHARIAMRLSDAEAEMLAELSTHAGLTRSDVVRQLVREAWEATRVEWVAAALQLPERRKRRKP